MQQVAAVKIVHAAVTDSTGNTGFSSRKLCALCHRQLQCHGPGASLTDDPTGIVRQLHCVLSEVDARVHGCAKYYRPLSRQGRDPTWFVRQAGWPDFEFRTADLHQGGEKVEVQTADRFGVMLYLCKVPKGKQYMRQQVYQEVLEAIEEVDNGVFAILENLMAGAAGSACMSHQRVTMTTPSLIVTFAQVKWDLTQLCAELRGAYEFPHLTGDCWCPSSAIALPAKTVTAFPRNLYVQPYYRLRYDAVKTHFLSCHPPGTYDSSMTSCGTGPVFKDVIAMCLLNASVVIYVRWSTCQALVASCQPGKVLCSATSCIRESHRSGQSGCCFPAYAVSQCHILIMLPSNFSLNSSIIFTVVA